MPTGIVIITSLDRSGLRSSACQSSSSTEPSAQVVLHDSHAKSMRSAVQRWLPKAKVVKCFNIINNQTMINPRMKEGMPTMIICGNDENAKRQTAAILKEFGWDEPIDIGGIDGARWLEACTALWVRLAVRLGSWTIAARILRQ